MATINGTLFNDDGITRPILNGTVEDDLIRGFAGNDIMNGSRGNDRMFGGIGNDRISGGAGNDRMFGEAGNDALLGEAGNDALFGGEGNDSLDGGVGADAMSGGAGDDRYFVNEVGDTVSETVNNGTDTVNSTIDYTLTDQVENLVLQGVASIDGFGNGLNNTITGNNANNSLRGLDGNDSLLGQGGADRLLGGRGSDRLNGGSGNDSLNGTSGFGSNVGEDEIDILTGGAGNDTFVLGDGDGIGDDVYYDSGAGSDFAVITDLFSGDRIQLRGNANQYSLGNHAAFLPELGGLVQGTGIYRGSGSSRDLVAIVQNRYGLDLNSSVFDYVFPTISPVQP